MEKSTTPIPQVVAASEESIANIARLDATHSTNLNALSSLLLRSESVASSKIERIEASIEDYAKASHGLKSNATASSMVASTSALISLINSAGSEKKITLEQILTAHKILMRDDPQESSYAGKLRDVQNWIGGSDYSPRGAIHVPPPPNLVADYTADLLAFVNRDDVPVLVQAAIAHAQFEMIHPSPTATDASEERSSTQFLDAKQSPQTLWCP